MTNMKRSLSDSEDDVFDDDQDDMKGSPSQSCHGVSDRKKRRGIIEKRRRDRINSSLVELRRLVPAAFEKQGSAKLEKAEILQMTVDHLKMLHSKGMNGYNLDTAALAMDYRSVGFRECAAEVARYLVAVEGMDIQDPLRLRLLSHLQCYSAQREVAAKATIQTSLQTSSWNHMTTHHSLGSQYGGSAMGSMPPPPPAAMITQHGNQASSAEQLSMSSHGVATYSSGETRGMTQHGDPAHMSMRNMSAQMPPASSSSTSQVASSVLSGLPQVHTQFPVSLGVNMPMLSPSGHYTSSASGLSQSVKPYRPWGAELAY